MMSQRHIKYVGWVIALLIIGYAFSLIGSPETNRKRMADNALVESLERLDCNVSRYFQQFGSAPSSLDQLQEALGKGDWRDKCQYCRKMGKDDFLEISNSGVKYTPNKTAYQVCAMFHFDVNEAFKKGNWSESVFADYKQGMNCFDRELRICK